MSAVFPLLSRYLTNYHAMEAYGGTRGIAQRILNLGTRWKWVAASRPGRFAPGVRDAGIRSIGGWVSSRAGLDAVRKKEKSRNCYISEITQRTTVKFSIQNIIWKLFDEFHSAFIGTMHPYILQDPQVVLHEFLKKWFIVSKIVT
jgi:hypothetical protein